MKKYLLTGLISIILFASGCKPYRLAGDFKTIAHKGGPAPTTSEWPYKKLYTDYKKFKTEEYFDTPTAFMACFCQTIDSLKVARKTPKINRYIKIVDYKMCTDTDTHLVKKTVLMLSPEGRADFVTTRPRFGRRKSKKEAIDKSFIYNQEILDYLRDKRKANYVYQGFYKRNKNDVLIIFQKSKKPSYKAVGFKGEINGEDGSLRIYEVYSHGAWQRLDYVFKTAKGDSSKKGIRFNKYQPKV